ncbi:MAG: electron transport complex subunit E [Kiritimatiellae bacterium]|jgi:electron transport complex protein RnfE|nr:electron transport complex subunit E [Kiritimatiellia bacterium]MBR4611129.1 electron transport complex subunit E [Kiritimatiellia bacterium]
MKIFSEFTKGLFKENPTFRLVLGMCPTLATTTSLENALGMGAATTFVLCGSNIVISLLRKVIPDKIRIPCFVIVIATFVTAVDLLMQAYAPALSEKLGIFIPLIVVNCIVFARAESFARKNAVTASFLDGLGMGVGFTMSLSLISIVRELLGTGAVTVWGNISFALPASIAPSIVLFVLPAGGFITLGCLLAAMNHARNRAAIKAGREMPPPMQLNCRSCAICHFGAPAKKEA